jgi:hypothetical protein
VCVLVTAGFDRAEHAAAAMIQQGREGQSLWVDNARLRIDYDLSRGVYTCRWGDGATIAGATCSAKLEGGTELIASAYARHECGDDDVKPFADATGKGLLVTIHHRSPDLPELRQHLWVYEDEPFIVVDVETVSSTVIRSNHIEPLLVDPPTTGASALEMPVGASLPQVLFVPFDNDAWVRYNNKHDPATDPDSYEVTAIYDNASRHGFVVGSITHDVWKTGIEARDVSPRRVGRLHVFGGAAGKLSRDDQPHGVVESTTIASPRILTGWYADWRDGLESFGHVNASIQPPLPWDGGVVFGWNSWAAHGGAIDLEKYLAASDYFKQHLQPGGFENQNAVYVNWDAGWAKCSEEQLRDGVRHVHANGQKAGIYMAPFGVWKKNELTQPVPGTDGRYTYDALLLRDRGAKPLSKLDDGYALDPTHPGTLEHIDWQLARFVDLGFDFVKLDFLNFATREGVHADPAVTTGIQAYNKAMKRIVADLEPKKIGRPFFISLSIAPLFPGGYGHSRRESCDVFGQISNSEYLLNAATYGWWISDTVYRFNDSDHIVLVDTHGATTDDEARTRFNASVVAGAVFIDSDDMSKPLARDRAGKFLTNSEINALARSGRPFRPVEVNTGDRATDVFVRADSTDSFYVAVFNYSLDQPVTKVVSLQRLDIPSGGTWQTRDLWAAGQWASVQDSLRVNLGPRSSTIIALVKNREGPSAK